MKKHLTTLLLIFLIGIVISNNQLKTVTADESIYIVKAGDTLYSISRHFDVSVSELKNLNGFKNKVIHVGQEVKIPSGDGKKYYEVKPGDTLYSIARVNNISVEKIKSLNNLGNNIITVGQKIDLGQPVVVTLSSSGTLSPQKNFSSKDIELLARMIHAEARGESYQGKVGVGAVILNRIESPEFPNTMEKVIYQRTKNGYQFSPVKDGSINLKPDEVSIKAAYEAIKGHDPTGGSLYFYNPDIATDKWITTLPVTTKIGNHLFAR